MFDRISILVTGRLWIGAEGTRSIGSVLQELIVGARSEIIIVAYRLTVSLREFIDEVEHALARGCIVRVILDGENALDPVEKAVLNRLISNYKSQMHVYDFISKDQHINPIALHAKAIVFDKRQAIVGSANFSKNGLESNHEMAVLLSGKPVRQVVKAIEQLIVDGLRNGSIILREG